MFELTRIGHLFLCVSVLLLVILLPVGSVLASDLTNAADFYEKGLEAMERRNCEQARSFFKKALQYAPEDDHRLRVQGLYFVEYLPNAKLRELETLCQPEQPPLPPPFLEIVSPKETKILWPFDQKSILIEGRTAKGQGKLVVTVDGSVVPLGTDGQFSTEIALTDSRKQVVIRVEDERRRYAEKELDFIGRIGYR